MFRPSSYNRVPARRRLPLASLLLALLLAGSAQAAVRVRIMPPDRATFAVGQRFDLRVEAEEVPPGEATLSVEVNGASLDRLPGIRVEQTSSASDRREVTARGLSFPEPLKGTIRADLRYSGGRVRTTSTFEVFQVRGSAPRAKNVILLVCDGMGHAHRSAARMVSQGINKGRYNGLLEMDRMDAYGYQFTSSLDSLVTDSAASISTQAGGNKTANGGLCAWPDNTKDPLDNPRYETILEYLKRTRGMAAGIVTTSTLTDATPAGFVAHSSDRGASAGIADQFLASGVDVLLGGGSKDFLPTADGGERKDDRNWVRSFRDAGYAYATTADELRRLPSRTRRVLGLFSQGIMATYVDQVEARRQKKDDSTARQPTLEEMTEAALEVLGRRPEGFFLMIEGASTDKQSHAGDAHRAIWETIEFDRAVGLAKRFAARRGDTLVIATGDHETGGMSIRGYSANPGELEVGWGAMDTKAGKVVVTRSPAHQGTGISEPSYQPPAGLPVGNSHTAVELPVTASGPGSSQFRGPMDQTEIFLKMLRALEGGYAADR